VGANPTRQMLQPEVGRSRNRGLAASVGQPISQFDAMIAGMTRSRGASLATRNIKAFENCSIDVVNPGRNYVLLTSLLVTAKESGRLPAATLIWRALLDAILARAYAKAYGHAARYLHELRAVAPDVGDYGGHQTHAEYEQSLRTAHGRKTSFWAGLVDE
jgi:hypothetical protein